MTQYRRKPLPVEAVQFYPTALDWPKGVRRWSGARPRDGSSGYIQTTRGAISVHNGDWIITVSDTQVYPLSPEQFEREYEIKRDCPLCHAENVNQDHLLRCLWSASFGPNAAYEPEKIKAMLKAHGITVEEASGEDAV